MRTLAFIGILVFGAAAYGQDCKNGNCAMPVIREVVTLPIRAAHAVIPNCNRGVCNSTCAEQVEVVDPDPVASQCQPTCKPARRCGFVAKLRSRVKCCK